MFKFFKRSKVKVSYQQDGIHYNFSKCKEQKTFNCLEYNPEKEYDGEIDYDNLHKRFLVS